jgi:hypothetical protein
MVGFALTHFAAGPLRLLRIRGKRLSRRPRLAVLLVGATATLVAVTVSWIRPPTPAIHDEFAYLLAADTFARGRITNPPHPLWQHFETYHVLNQPTYASKYPPAQGLVLALGKVAGGSPLVGLWISVGFAAGAMCWMLQGWVPGRWALLGGLLIALHPLIQIHWAQTYWGGNVALAGGALLFGAYPRLIRFSRARDALVMALGLAILANSRPLEGLVVSLPVAIALVFCFCATSRPNFQAASLRIFVPLLATLAATGAAMAHYNATVTGDPWKMPYSVHKEAYEVTPMFIWQEARPAPKYRHAVMRAFYDGWARESFESQKRPTGFFAIKGTQFALLWHWLLGTSLTIALLASGCRAPRHSRLLPLVCILTCLTALGVGAWTHPHYFAPAVAAVVLLVIQGMRRLRLAVRGARPVAGLLLPAVLIAQVLLFLALTCLYLAQQPGDWATERIRIASALQNMAGNHLVIVQYGHGHNPHAEWVYNGADIDGSKVVWARSMDDAANKRLLAYFENRRVWLLPVDEGTPRLRPYATSKP